MINRDYAIDLFRPDDARGVSLLFKEVYGDGYPVKLVYDADEFARAVDRQDYIPVVARTPDRSIVGFAAFYRSTPNPKLYEMGLAMVSAKYRGTPIIGLLFRRLVKTAFLSPEFDAFFGETVCNHVLTQKATAVFKAVETAIEVDLMPSETYEKEKSAEGRVSTVISVRTLVPRPHVIYVPEIYEGYLAYVYHDFDDSRTFKRSDEEFSPGIYTNMAAQVYEGANIARISVKEAGADFETVLDLEEKKLQNKGICVIQVFLNISMPWVGRCVEILRSRGYFFCGTFPRWFGDDALLMENIKGQPNWEGIKLYSHRAREILNLIREDQDRTSTMY